MPAERRCVERSGGYCRLTPCSKAAQAAHDTLTAGSSKRAERPPPAEKKIKFSEFEGQVSALDITIAGKSITEQLKLKAEPKAFTKQERRGDIAVELTRRSRTASARAAK